MSLIKMYPKLLQFIPTRIAIDCRSDQQQEEDLKDATSSQHRMTEPLIFTCWGLILLKSFVVVWAVDHYRMPFSPMWVIGPTVAFAALGTAAYYYLKK